MRLSFIIVLLSVIVSVFSVQAAVPLRGTLKDDGVKSSSTSTAAPKKLVVRSAQGDQKAAQGGQGAAQGGQENAQGDQENAQGGQENAQGGQENAQGGQENAQGGQENAQGGQENAQGNTVATEASGATDDTKSAGSSDSTSDSTQTVDPMESCGTSFVMWYTSGVPVTTLACGPYTIVYASVESDKKPGPRYVSGAVTTVTVDKAGSTSTLKINGQDFATLSVDSSNPTAAAKAPAASARLLQQSDASTSAVQMTDAYSFTLKGGKEIVVGVPADSSNTSKYSLSANDETFYTGANSGGTDGLFKLNENGDLVDSKNNVVLKDADSSAFGLRYVIPSIFAIFAAFFML